MRTFKIYSLNNFQIRNTVLLTLVTMLHIISPWLTYFTTGSLYLLTPFTHFTPNPRQPSVFSRYPWAFFKKRIAHINEITVFVFVWFISLSICSHSAFMLLQMVLLTYWNDLNYFPGVMICLYIGLECKSRVEPSTQCICDGELWVLQHFHESLTFCSVLSKIFFSDKVT